MTMNLIRRLLLCAVPLLLLTSCAKDRPMLVIMKHPDTMDFQNCKVADWGSEEAFMQNEACVKGYQQQGYTIWGSR